MLTKKNTIALLLLFLMMMQLTGCFFKSGDELYTLPQPPENYLDLQKKIDAVLDAGAEFAAPASGMNSQSVQLVDIDGDGETEAVAFFRFSGDKPLKIYIFKIVKDTYENVAKIEGSGTSIDAIEYADLNGDGKSEIIVGWQISTDIHAMTVYSLLDYKVTELMVSSYTKYLVYDMDNSGFKDIVTIRFDTVDQVGIAELYSWRGKEMKLISQSNLSVGRNSPTRVKTGYVEEMVPAVFISGGYGTNGIITDILACRDGEMVNITMNSDTGISEEMVRNYAVYATDINGDSIIELPQPVQLPVYKDRKSADTNWKIYWRNYDLSGKTTKICTTYHNNADGWYLVLPENWENRIAIARRDMVSGERTIIFSVWTDENTKPVEFLCIYTLTGDNRENRAVIGNRFILAKQVEAVYAAEFLAGNGSWQFGVGKEELISRFHLIKKEWITGDY